MALESVKKYQTVTKTAEAIPFIFDNLKDIYMFLNFADVTYYIKDRVIAGIITDDKGYKVDVAKDDYVIKTQDNEILVMNKTDFEKTYVLVSTVKAKQEAETEKIVSKALAPVKAELSSVKNELSATQSELDITNKELEKTVEQLKEAESKLAEYETAESDTEESEISDDSE